MLFSTGIIKPDDGPCKFDVFHPFSTIKPKGLVKVLRVFSKGANIGFYGSWIFNDNNNGNVNGNGAGYNGVKIFGTLRVYGSVRKIRKIKRRFFKRLSQEVLRLIEVLGYSIKILDALRNW